jgi:hypothetical protein
MVFSCKESYGSLVTANTKIWAVSEWERDLSTR